MTNSLMTAGFVLEPASVGVSHRSVSDGRNASIARRVITVLMCFAACAAALSVAAEARAAAAPATGDAKASPPVEAEVPSVNDADALTPDGAKPLPEGETRHATTDWVYVYNPIGDGDGDHSDVTAWWPSSLGTSPAGHHIVYSNWGFKNDWSIDVYARASGRTFVTPFASRTNTGHAVQSKVIDVRAGCATGNAADGGYRVTVEASDTATGTILGRADLMHVSGPRVARNQVLGAWTIIGYTSRFRYTSCYQVNTNNGIHGHLEFINRHRYACWIPYSYGQGLSELTRIGKVGTHHSGQRARC